MRALALALVLAAGCGPSLVWYTRSPDRRTRVDVLARGGQVWVRAGGREGPRFDAVGEIACSDDSRHVAYPGRRGDRWVIVRDGAIEGGPFVTITSLRFSPDGRRLAYVGEDERGFHVVVDGRPGPPLPAVRDLRFGEDGALAAVTVAPGCARVVVDDHDGRCYAEVGRLELAAAATYLAKRDGAVFVVRGADELGPFDEVTALATGRGGHLAFAARHGARWAPVVDGTPGAMADAVRGLAFSPAGDRLAYVAREGDSERVVVMTVNATPAVLQEGPRFPALEAPVWSASGDRLGAIAHDRDGDRLVLDGVAGDRLYAAATALTFSPDGRRHAAVVHRAGRNLLVVDGREHPFDVIIAPTLTFSQDSQHFACLVGDVGRRRLFLTNDGGRERAFDGEELFGGSPAAFDEVRLRRWVVAELALELAGRKGS